MRQARARTGSGGAARMGGLPRWYPIAAVTLAASLGAALGAGWSAVHPSGSPGFWGLAALFAAAAAAGTAAAARPRGVLLRRRVWLMARAAARIAPEVALGAAGAVLLTGRWGPTLLVLVLLRIVRGQGYTMARRVLTIRTAGNPGTILKARAAGRRWVPVAMAATAVAVVGSGLDRSGGLAAWRSAPVVLAAGAAALVLLAGVEREALAARFRRARAVVSPSLGQGWWGSAGGWIVLLLISAALLPPPPAVWAMGHVRQALENGMGRLLLAGAAPPPSPAPVHSVAPPKSMAPDGWRERAAVLLTGGLMLGLLVWVAVDLWRDVRRLRLRLGDSVRDMLAGLASAIRDAVALLVGFAAALGAELRGGGWLGGLRVLWDAVRAAGVGLSGLWRWRWSWHWRRGARRTPEAGAPPRQTLGAQPPRWTWGLSSGDPRRRVREAYRAFMAGAGRAGLGRAPAQTPSSHHRAVAAADPGAEDDLGDLTEAYQWARFSPHAVSGEQAASAQGAWRRLAARLAQRVRRRPGP